jgi:hypothetical protein
MNTRRTFVRLVAAAAVAAVAIAAGDWAAGRAVDIDRLAFALDPCPFGTTIDGGLGIAAALIAPLPPDSGFACPITRAPATSVAALPYHVARRPA